MGGGVGERQCTIERQKVHSAVGDVIRSVFCSHLCGSVKWLYEAEPRVGWVRSLYPGSVTQLPQQFLSLFYALYGSCTVSLTHLRNRNQSYGNRIRSGVRSWNESAQG